MKFLVPFRLPEPEEFSPEFTSLLRRGDIIVLGCYVVPEQTPLEQARDSFETEASNTLQQLISRLEGGCEVVDSELVFTPDLLATLERVAEDRDVDVIVTPRSIGSARRLLVLLTEDGGFSKLSEVVDELVDDRTESLTVLHLGEPDDEIELALQGFEKKLAELDISEDIITLESSLEPDRDAVTDQATHSDVIVIGERQLTFQNAALGTVSERVIVEQTIPVFVVRLDAHEPASNSDE